MSPNIQSDIKILDNLLALNLDISVWSARKKMSAEDLGGAELPPEDLASLGSKRIADPEKLKIFSTLKSRAFNFLDRHGVRFMSGWAIPENKAVLITEELVKIRSEFFAARNDFLSGYDQGIEEWIAKHAAWGEIIRDSIVSPDYVRSRMDFRWQLYKVEPMKTQKGSTVEAGLAEEVTGLGNTIFDEIARSATEIWRKVYRDKTEVTHKALSPLRTLKEKLAGLSFVEPHIMPVVEMMETSLKRVPAKGNISGPDLLMLQGLVNLLRDPNALVQHAQKLIEGYGSTSVLDSLLSNADPFNPESVCEAESVYRNEAYISPLPPTYGNLSSYGLW